MFEKIRALRAISKKTKFAKKIKRKVKDLLYKNFIYLNKIINYAVKNIV